MCTDLKYSTIANTISGIYFMFYFCCWCVLSLLRYIYIVKKSWIEVKIPEIKVIRTLSLSAAFVLSLFFIGSNMSVFLYFGWPKMKIYEMPPLEQAIANTTLLGTYLTLIGISCFFYILILRERVTFSFNSIVPCDSSNRKRIPYLGKQLSKNSTIDEESNFGGVWMGGNSPKQVNFEKEI